MKTQAKLFELTSLQPCSEEDSDSLKSVISWEGQDILSMGHNLR